MAEKAATYGADIMRMAEKSLLLQILDQIWKEHLLALDHLRQGINLRAYAQRDPLNEYKREAFELFQEMLVAPARAGDERALPCRAARRSGPRSWRRSAAPQRMVERHDAGSPSRSTATAASPPRPRRRRRRVAAPWARTPRNAPCPCGSGKKYKHCHGRT